MGQTLSTSSRQGCRDIAFWQMKHVWAAHWAIFIVTLLTLCYHHSFICLLTEGRKRQHASLRAYGREIPGHAELSFDATQEDTVVHTKSPERAGRFQLKR